jgi:hypothetical protein
VNILDAVGRVDDSTLIAYDAKLMRPGCVLIQAAMGGDPALTRRFDSDTWLVDMTPDMKRYRVTPAQAERLIELTARKAKKGRTR